MMTNKNRLEIRLDPDSQQLLDSLIARTNLTKTSLIKKALIVYASTLKKGHIYTVKLKAEASKIIEDEPQNEIYEEISDEEWNKVMKDLENGPKNDDL